jgi:hypothetical protein
MLDCGFWISIGQVDSVAKTGVHDGDLDDGPTHSSPEERTGVRTAAETLVADLAKG